MAARDKAPRAPGRNPTLVDVADRAGVSHTTVSLALRGSPRISAKRTQQIQRIAQQLGYQPRAAAQMLRSSRTGWIGLLLEGVNPHLIAESGFSAPILTRFLACTQQRSQRQMVEFFHCPADGPFQPPQCLGGGFVDGVIVGGFVDGRLREWLARQRIYPWVSIGEPGPHSVQEDPGAGVTEAMDMLVGLGHRRIAICVGPSCYATHKLKLDAFRVALRKHRLSLPHASFAASFDERPAAELALEQAGWARGLLQRADRPTAFLCQGHVGRDVVLMASQLGLEVPRDLSIVSFVRGIEAMRNVPALASVESDDASIVESALDRLAALLRGEEVATGVTWFPPVLTRRDSVAGAPTEG
ncbi:MAG: LacI family DNA-binding transcriptional regulator [Planctomycetes bacterium]|nr:LacI family DNA-binding transcriptional regulator [Planctomycetota bacterium]